MAALKKPEWEKFAQELAKGANITKAYALAGYKKHHGNAQRLSQNEKVRARIDELTAAASERCEIDIARTLAELGKLGFSNMGAYARLAAEGEPYIDRSDLTEDQWAAVQEITVEDFTEGRGDDARDVRRVKIKLADKKAPLVAIGRGSSPQDLSRLTNGLSLKNYLASIMVNSPRLLRQAASMLG